MSKIASFAIAFLGVNLSIMAACSSDSPAVVDGTSADGGTGADGAMRVVHVEEVRAALKPLADAECKWLFQCCSVDERAAEIGPAPTAADCSDRVFQSDMVSYTIYSLPLKDSTKTVLRQLSRLGYGFDYGRVTIDAAAVQACAQSISAAACNQAPPKDHCEPKAPPASDPCDVTKLLIGKQQQGDVCDTSSSDCAPGLFCQNSFGPEGVCVKSAKAGDTCFDDQDCGDAVCDFATGRCVTGADFAAACSFSNPDRPEMGTERVRCRKGLICDSVTLKCADQDCAGGGNCQTNASCPTGTACINYRCGTPAKPGEPCSRETDCAMGLCRFDSAVMRQLCSAPAADGSSCNQDEDCANHYCKFGNDGGECTPQLPLNAPCPSGEARECVTHRCQAQGVMNVLTCVPGPAVDDTCSTDGQCNPQDKLFCVAMKCKKAPFDNGADCTSAQQCKSEVCLATKCAPKGQAGATCATAKSAPCDTDFFCETSGDGAPEGVCKAKKPEGAPCTTPTQCWTDCRASHGALRCVGTGPGQAHCGG